MCVAMRTLCVLIIVTSLCIVSTLVVCTLCISMVDHWV